MMHSVSKLVFKKSTILWSDDPEAEDVGHKWTLSALLRHLRAQGTDTSLLMQRIEEVVVKAVLATAPPIISACRMFVPYPRNCFELYGFDILIDSTLKPWLLEVNLSPSLGCDSPLDIRIKSAMLVDLLTLVGLPTVDPMLRRANENRRPTSQLDILKKLSCRRVQSADALSVASCATGKKAPQIVTSSRLIASSLSLSPEENRMIRTVRSEFERKGGFLRIFPSAESWKRYGIFWENPVTGITCTSAAPGGQSCVPPMVVPHNYNLLLHQQLFPELQSSRKTIESSTPTDHLTRYERALLQGHKASLEERQLDKSGCGLNNSFETIVKQNKHMSQYQARRTFAQYLICILRRISGQNKTDPIIEDHSELILRFLQKASSNLRTPYFVQIPSRKLAGKDRVAVVAKQLNDFIYLYNRETDLYSEGGDKPNLVPSKLYQQFLSSASEQDLEDILSVQTKLYKCTHLCFGRSGLSPSSSRPFSLLRSLPASTASSTMPSTLNECLLRIGLTSMPSGGRPKNFQISPLSLQP
ncbi:hypothetical protein L9F63_027844, partial [Diploptera punctata]